MALQRSEYVTSRLTLAIPSLHTGGKHTGFNGAGHGELKNFVVSRNWLHGGYLHSGWTVKQNRDQNARDR